jgi:hypothetical protein
MDGTCPSTLGRYAGLGRRRADRKGKMKNASPAFAGEAFSVVRGDTVSGETSSGGADSQTKEPLECNLFLDFFARLKTCPVSV